MLIDALHAYLSIRRKLGYKLKSHEKYLRHYIEYAIERGDNYVVSKTAIDWASKGASANARARRLSILIQFALFLHAEDERHEVPPDKVFCSRRHRRRPYIFTDQEIVQLIMQSKRLGPSNSLRPLTYSTLLGLLASTGLRISEALSLRLADITADGLFIRETKFRKSRIVPLHPTAIDALNRYLDHRRRLRSSDDHVFVSHDEAKKITYNRVAKIFRQLLQDVGINPQGDEPRPRLHCLRHSFATKALRSCPDSRDRVTRHMLAISTYMGHIDIKSTYWYLETTPELMNDIANACQAFMQKEVT